MRVLQCRMHVPGNHSNYWAFMKAAAAGATAYLMPSGCACLTARLIMQRRGGQDQEEEEEGKEAGEEEEGKEAGGRQGGGRGGGGREVGGGPGEEGTSY